MTSTLPHRLRTDHVAAPCPFPASLVAARRRRGPTTPYLELDVRTARRPLRRAGRGRCPAPPCTTPSRPTRTRGCSPSWPPSAAASTSRARRRCGPRSPPAPRPTPSSTPTRSSAATTSSRPRALGVRLFVVDSLDEVEKVAEALPAAQVLCRLVTSGEGSDWPLSRKYGCSTYEAVEMLTLADQLGLDAAGVSFHVGSQQRDPEAWGEPDRRRGSRLRAAARARSAAPAPRPRRRLPGEPTTDGCRPLAAYGEAIERHLDQHFGDRPSATPSSSPAAGSSGTPGPSSRRSSASSTGAACAGSTSTPASSPGWSRPWTRPSATGSSPRPTAARRDRACWPDRPATAPTCSTRTGWSHLPVALAEGDEVRLLSAGAYTSCYSSVGFNGFEPLPTVLVRAR